jgi:putative ABC transport system permease protein
MLKLAWRGVVHNRGRYIATLVAIMTGVAFFTATGFVSDRVIQSLEGDADRRYAAVDVAITADTSGSAEQKNLASQNRIPAETAEKIAALEGVEATGGVLTGQTAFLGAGGQVFGKGATGRLWIEDQELNPLEVKEGRAPSAAGEIAVDAGLATNEDLTVGQRVTLLTLAGREPATIVGITKFGDSDSIDSGGTVSVPAPTAFDWLSSGRREYSELYVRGSGDQQALVDEATALVPPGFQAQTGEEFLDEQRNTIGSLGNALKRALQGFAILALLVGAFVIYNTFSVIVAQRMKEIAVLAAIGATPKQIRRSLRWEGVVIGLVGSFLGVVIGIALSFGVIAVLSAFGVSLPGSGVSISWTTVLYGVLIGTAITVLSVIIPARRASRTEPIEALRDAQVETSAVTRRRTVTALVLVALGVLLLLGGGSAPLVGLGVVLLFVGVIVSGPMIAVAGAKLVTPVMSRLGLEGRLAADNTRRNPKRTATTANALLIGVFLVSFVTVAGTSLKDFAVGELKKIESADYLLVSTGGTVDRTFVADLENVDGVTQVVAFQRQPVQVDGKPSLLSTADIPTLQDVAAVTAERGSLEDLADGTVAVVQADPSTPEKTPALGSSVTVTDPSGATRSLKVAAVLDSSIDTSLTGNLVNAATFADIEGNPAPTAAFIDVDDGDETATKKAIEDVVALRPDIDLQEGNAIARIVGSVFDFVIKAVDGLLLMSVIIALIGIVNTLSLSILERRRELGLLRVVGMTDKRVQRMVRLESILISALGTVTGLVLGAFVGWALLFTINRLSDASVGFSFPTFTLLLILVAGIVLGLLASLIPARRSTRLEVLEAIQTN